MSTRYRGQPGLTDYEQALLTTQNQRPADQESSEQTGAVAQQAFEAQGLQQEAQQQSGAQAQRVLAFDPDQYKAKKAGYAVAQNQIEQTRLSIDPDYQRLNKEKQEAEKEREAWRKESLEQMGQTFVRKNVETGKATPIDAVTYAKLQDERKNRETYFAKVDQDFAPIEQQWKALDQQMRNLSMEKLREEELALKAKAGMIPTINAQSAVAAQRPGQVNQAGEFATFSEDSSQWTPEQTRLWQAAQQEQTRYNQSADRTGERRTVSPLTAKIIRMEMAKRTTQEKAALGYIDPQEAQAEIQRIDTLQQQTKAQAQEQAKQNLVAKITGVKPDLTAQGIEIARGIIGQGTNAARLAGATPGTAESIKGNLNDAWDTQGQTSIALKAAGMDIDKAIAEEKRKAADMKKLATGPRNYPVYGGAPTAELVGGKTEEVVRNLESLKKQFTEAGITNPAEQKRIIEDTAKAEAWTEQDTDKTRVLSNGAIVFNPGKAFGEYNAMVKDIEAKAKTPEQAEDAKKRLDAARQVMAEKMDSDLYFADKTRAGVGEKIASAVTGKGVMAFIEDGYRDYTEEMQAKGITDKVQILDGFVAKQKDRFFAFKFQDAVQTGLAIGTAGIYKTLVGTGAGLAAVAGAEKTAAALGQEQVATGQAQEGISEAARIQGNTGAYALATDLTSTVTQMAPMFIGGGAAAGLKGIAQVATRGASVYGWAAAQGFESMTSIALDKKKQELNRDLSPEEVVSTLQDPKVIAAAFGNAVQTAALARLMPKGSERMALGLKAESMTARQFLTGGGARVLKDGTFRKEMVAMGKTIWADAKDEAIEESLNQMLETFISASAGQKDLKLGDAIEEWVKAGALGGLVGGGINQVAAGTTPEQRHAEILNRINQRVAAPADLDLVAEAIAEVDPAERPATAEEIKEARMLANPDLDQAKEIQKQQAAYKEAIAAKDYVKARTISEAIEQAGTDAEVNTVRETADAVLLVRELAETDQQTKQDFDAAQQAFNESMLTGDKLAKQEAGSALAVARQARNEHLQTRAAVKIASGKDVSELTDAEIRAMGYTLKPDGTGYAPMNAKQLADVGLTAPMIRPAPDGSVILTDDVVAVARATSERAGNRIKLSEQEAVQMATARATAAQTPSAAPTAAPTDSLPDGQPAVEAVTGTVNTATAAPPTPGGVGTPLSQPGAPTQAAATSGQSQQAPQGAPAVPVAVAGPAGNTPETMDAAVYEAARQQNPALPEIPQAVGQAFAAGRPVSVSMQKQSGIDVPEGYTRQGSIWTPSNPQANEQNQQGQPAGQGTPQAQVSMPQVPTGTPAQPQAAGQPPAATAQAANQVAANVQATAEATFPRLKGKIRIESAAIDQNTGQRVRTGGASAELDGGVTIYTEDIADQLASNPAETVESIVSAIVADHEVTHVAQVEAVRDIWKAKGSPGTFPAFFREWYGEMADQLAPEVFQEARKIYGKEAWDAQPKHNQAAEVVRMLVEASRPGADQAQFTELLRAVKLQQSPNLIETIRRAIEKLMEMLGAGNLPENVREHIAAIEALYADLTADPNAVSDAYAAAIGGQASFDFGATTGFNTKAGQLGFDFTGKPTPKPEATRSKLEEPPTAIIPSTPSELEKGKWKPNHTVFSAVSYPDYQLLGVIQVPHDGTEKGMGEARAKAMEEAQNQFGDIQTEETDKGIALFSSPDLFAAANAPDAAEKLGDVKAGKMNALRAYRSLTAKRDAGKSLTAEEEQQLLDAEQALGQKMAFDMEAARSTAPATGKQSSQVPRPAFGQNRRDMQDEISRAGEIDRSGQISLLASPDSSSERLDEDGKTKGIDTNSPGGANIGDGFLPGNSSESQRILNAFRKARQQAFDYFAKEVQDYVAPFKEKLRSKFGFISETYLDERDIRDELAKAGAKIISEFPIFPAGQYVGSMMGGEAFVIHGENPNGAKRWWYAIPQRPDVDSFGQNVIITDKALNHEQFLTLWRLLTGYEPVSNTPDLAKLETEVRKTIIENSRKRGEKLSEEEMQFLSQQPSEIESLRARTNRKMGQLRKSFDAAYNYLWGGDKPSSLFGITQENTQEKRKLHEKEIRQDIEQWAKEEAGAVPDDATIIMRKFPNGSHRIIAATVGEASFTIDDSKPFHSYAYSGTWTLKGRKIGVGGPRWFFRDSADEENLDSGEIISVRRLMDAMDAATANADLEKNVDDQVKKAMERFDKALPSILALQNRISTILESDFNQSPPADTGGLYSSPAFDPVAMATEKAPPVYRKVYGDIMAGHSPAEVMARYSISQKAVTNIINQMQARITVASKAAAGTLQPEMQDGQFAGGRPDLAEGAKADFVAVDQIRNAEDIPEIRSRKQVMEQAEARLAKDYEGEFNRLEQMAIDGDLPEDIDVAIAKEIFRREALSGGLADPARRARVALFRVSYRDMGSEQARAFSMRQDEAMPPAMRNAMHLAELLYEPSPQTRDRIKNAGKDKPTIDAIMKQWMEKIDKFKREMKTQGLDIDASLAAFRQQQEAIKEAEQVHTGSKEAMDKAMMKLSQREKTVIRLIRDGAKLSGVKRATGMSKEQIMDVKHRFGNEWRKAIIEAGKRFAADSLAASPSEDIYDMVMTDLGWQSDDDFDDTAPDYIQKQEEKRKEAKKRDRQKATSTRAPRRSYTPEQQAAIMDAWKRFQKAPPATWATFWQEEMKTLTPIVGATGFAEFQGDALQPWKDLWQAEMDAITDPAGRMTFEEWLDKPAADWTAKQIDLLDERLWTPEQKAAWEEKTRGLFHPGDPAPLSDIANEWSRRNGSWINKATEWFKMSILSGPQTMLVNTSGGLHVGYDLTLKRAVEATWNSLLSLFGQGDVRSATFSEFLPMIKNVRAAVQLAARNAARAWELESPVFDSYAEAKPIQLEFSGVGNEYAPPALGTNSWKELAEDPSFKKLAGAINRTMRNITFRELTAVDEFWKGLYSQLDVAAMSHRIAAKEEKLTGDAYAARVAELMKPGSIAWLREVPKAKKITFQDNLAYGQWTKEDERKNPAHKAGSPMTWQQAAKKSETESAWTLLDALAVKAMEARKTPFLGPILHIFALPFITTPKNLIQRGLEVTPVGLFVDIVDGMRSLRRRMISGQITKEESLRIAGELYNKTRFIETLTNQSIGVMVYLLAEALAGGDDDDKRPHITGTSPFSATKEGERDIQEAVMPAQSIRIGDTIIPYGRIEPFSTFLSAYADLAVSRQRNNGYNAKVVTDQIVGAKEQLKNKLFLKGLGDIIRVVENPTRGADRLAANYITGFAPNLIRQPIRETDSFRRDANPLSDDGFFEAVAKRIGYTIVPQLAPPKIDVWGNPIKAHRGELVGGHKAIDALFRILDPTNTLVGMKPDELDAWIFRYNLTTPDMKDRISITPIDRTLRLTIEGEKKQREVDLSETEHRKANEEAGRMARDILGGGWDKKPTTPEEAERILTTVRDAQKLVRANLRERKKIEILSTPQP